MTRDLFADFSGDREVIGAQAWVLRGFALPWAAELLAGVDEVQQVSPFRHMVTPGGFKMSVALTSCGPLGWTTDRRGYRYTPTDPLCCPSQKSAVTYRLDRAARLLVPVSVKTERAP